MIVHFPMVGRGDNNLSIFIKYCRSRCIVWSTDQPFKALELRLCLNGNGLISGSGLDLLYSCARLVNSKGLL